VRTLTVPDAIRREIVKHLMEFTGPGQDALVFTRKRGNALRPGNFNQLVRWTKTVKDMGMPGLHFHVLRHTGNTLAAQTGVSTKDLMLRMGHDDMRAALIYQRASSEADKKIAERLSDLVDDHQSRAETTQPDDDDDPREGTADQSVPIG
jgi:integrase